jgi:hypothetical protein
MSLERILLRSCAALAFCVLLASSAVAQQYQILRAEYGWGNQVVDVTQRLREIAASNTTFRMGNSTFGVDPAPGHVKTLRIYARGPNGRNRMFEYREGSTVDGAMFSDWSGGRWGSPGDRWGDRDEGQYTILRALYGIAGRNVDVTQRLRELARSDARFRMGNSTFGVDPAPGHVKTLRIYARGRDGDERMFEYREGSTVDGSIFTGWGRGDWGYERWNGRWGDNDRDDDSPRDNYSRYGDRGGQLRIIRAEYGAPGRTRDVSGRLQSMVRDGRLSTRVNNDTMGTDPAPHARKPSGSRIRSAGQVNSRPPCVRASDSTSRRSSLTELCSDY